MRLALRSRGDGSRSGWCSTSSSPPSGACLPVCLLAHLRAAGVWLLLQGGKQPFTMVLRSPLTFPRNTWCSPCLSGLACRAFLLPSRQRATDGSVVELTRLETLYKTFERC